MKVAISKILSTRGFEFISLSFFLFGCHQHHLLNKLLRLKFFLTFYYSRGQGECFSFFLNCSRGGGAPLFIYFDFFLLLKTKGES